MLEFWNIIKPSLIVEMELLVILQKKIKILIIKLFGGKFIKNTPYFPDIAYPTETLYLN